MPPKRTIKRKDNGLKKSAKNSASSLKKDAIDSSTSSAKKGVSKKQASLSHAKKADVSKSYKELIAEALTALNDRKGSSRPAIKKYIKEYHPSVGAATGFDSYFNNAIKKGVEANEFSLPKGPSGALKLVKPPLETAEKLQIEKTEKTETKGRSPKTENGVKSLEYKGNPEDDPKQKRGRPRLSETSSKVAGSADTKSPERIKKQEQSQPAEKPKSRRSKNAKAEKGKPVKVEKISKTKLPQATYKEMITSGILHLNGGKGSSRSALKKFVRDQYKSSIKSGSNFDHLFNSAIKKGIESGDFLQPKGPSSVVKVIKKENIQLA
ncbi:HHO1 (YPL127C) [Zygosaccharomyces parabailii]|uniref:Histone H1 n=1 Tax=Zygosaccharomyces bailii (strain CLIB 213 / ATCC 58445 / CBS 680 / BCRC 21525 / NBRC 1098 / NCYC 1416 / NRRL Y-2227) TaxID=1333698 RepID=A0A8J2X9Y9_ZYGB2|nr:HHO1 (YPL127C) [Zygosaccharomyces parabailii]CDF91005.1 ZYBA0S09-02674g1_1 [Zygosaccharomyces bailii CLIB 213]